MLDRGIRNLQRWLLNRGVKVSRPDFPADHPIDLLTILLDRERAIGPDFHAVQIGANDGVSGDPIHQHVKDRGWTLLAVEPMPLAFGALSRTYSDHANVTCENSAISSHDGTMTLHVVEGDLATTKISSFSREVLLKQRVMIPDLKDRIREIEVPCLTFKGLLEKHRLERVDLVWIDTEGFDFEIIKMMIGADILPKFIGFESVHFSQPDKKACAGLLASKGYRWLSIGLDTIAYLQESDRDSGKRAFPREEPARGLAQLV